MSLNGLEAPEVNDAYQAALSEGGGWLVLLKPPQDKESEANSVSVGSCSII